MTRPPGISAQGDAVRQVVNHALADDGPKDEASFSTEGEGMALALDTPLDMYVERGERLVPVNDHVTWPHRRGLRPG